MPWCRPTGLSCWHGSPTHDRRTDSRRPPPRGRPQGRASRTWSRRGGSGSRHLPRDAAQDRIRSPTRSGVRHRGLPQPGPRRPRERPGRRLADQPSHPPGVLRTGQQRRGTLAADPPEHPAPLSGPSCGVQNPPRHHVRLTRRLGDSITRAQPQGYLARLIQANPVANRNKHGLHPIPRAQRMAENLSTLRQRRPGTAPESWIHKVGDEGGLGDSEGWNTSQHTNMAGQAETSRMRNSITVTDQHLRLSCQPLERIQQDRSFAKGEQTRDVWESSLPDSGRHFRHRQRLQLDHHGRCTYPVCRFLVRHVKPHHRLRGRPKSS